MAKALAVLLIVTLPLLISSFFPYSTSTAAAIFIIAVILWFTEIIPLPITGLLIPILIALTGQMPAGEVFKAFGSDILFLFIGCFLLAESMTKHGWDKRMAFYVLASPIGAKSPNVIVSAIALMAWILSMWISNTATCAMLTAVAIGIINTYKDSFNSEIDRNNFSTKLLLAVAFGSTMGGLATPIGTPPNLIALQLLRNAGSEISFFDWMMIGLPISFVMIILLLVVLTILFPVTISAKSEEMRTYFKQSLKNLGAIKIEEIQVAVVFLFAVLFWILPGAIKDFYPDWESINTVLKPFSLSIVALLSALILFILPSKDGRFNLEWKDAKKIEWGTILLFGGGIALGELLTSSGLAKEIGTIIFGQNASLILLIFIIVAISVFISEFASNTAAASIVIPIIISSTGNSELALSLLVLAASFGASFGFMLPVSTPPNAIIYGTGKIKLQSMVRTGIIFDLVGIVAISLWIWLLFYV